MSNKQPNLIEQIASAQRRTTELFLRQCTYGEQTKILSAEFAACGQFIGEDAENIGQHGLHGISAAVRVLGPCQSQECRTVVHKIVTYCEASFGVHPTLPKLPHLDERHDTQNVIKLGELLYALSFVTTAQAERDRLVNHVSKLLQGSLIGGQGWGYFLGDTEPQLLPTAYSARGLAENGYDIVAPRRFLQESLAQRESSTQNDAADLTTTVACAYCMTFYRGSNPRDSALRGTFISAWKSLEPLLAEDIEQNLEYWRGTETHYVRVPWQLYLLALASEYSPWRFATFRSQRRLKAVIRAIQSNSFKYPYSGSRLSSRTNSVAFDALSEIRTRIRHLIFLDIAFAIDYVRVSAGSRFVRYVVVVLALVLIFYSAHQWWRNARTISDLAPHFISGLIMLMLAWARR
jgi:hypothetical protein